MPLGELEERCHELDRESPLVIVCRSGRRSLVAADYLQQAESKMTDLEQRYGDEIPPGHVPLLVTKEKIAALKDQLATQ